MTSTPKKKSGKIALPGHLCENKSLDIVASPLGPIQTIPVSNTDKDIILERLRVEIVKKFGFSLSRNTRQEKGVKHHKSLSQKRKRSVVEDEIPVKNEMNDMVPLVRKRLAIGINQCTRALEASKFPSSSTSKAPLLVILARDLRPPTVVAHIPLLCKQMDVPILMLPGLASIELGEVLQGKSASVLVFLEKDDKTYNKMENECHRKIDSYIQFALKKVPTGD